MMVTFVFSMGYCFHLCPHCFPSPLTRRQAQQPHELRCRRPAAGVVAGEARCTPYLIGSSAPSSCPTTACGAKFSSRSSSSSRVGWGCSVVNIGAAPGSMAGVAPVLRWRDLRFPVLDLRLPCPSLAAVGLVVDGAPLDRAAASRPGALLSAAGLLVLGAAQQGPGGAAVAAGLICRLLSGSPLWGLGYRQCTSWG
jgi:hypothetical protein